LTFDWSVITLCPIEKREVIHAKEEDRSAAKRLSGAVDLILRDAGSY
jgi:hypothetical protein